MVTPIELWVETQLGGDDMIEREIIIQDYNIIKGRPAITNLAPEDCSPGEADEIEDILVLWADTQQPLTDEEYDEFEDQIKEAILDSQDTEEI